MLDHMKAPYVLYYKNIEYRTYFLYRQEDVYLLLKVQAQDPLIYEKDQEQVLTLPQYLMMIRLV